MGHVDTVFSGTWDMRRPPLSGGTDENLFCPELVTAEQLNIIGSHRATPKVEISADSLFELYITYFFLHAAPLLLSRRAAPAAR